jgi:hypothetical protein
MLATNGSARYLPSLTRVLPGGGDHLFSGINLAKPGLFPLKTVPGMHHLFHLPCIQMEELEISRDRYADRRHKTVSPKLERRRWSPDRHRLGLAQSSYLIQVHLQNCLECRASLNYPGSGAARR